MLVNVLFPIHAEAFTYRVPDDMSQAARIGFRVVAPFKRAEKVGVIVSQARSSEETADASGKGMGRAIRIRPISSVLDDEPVLSDRMIKLITWVAHYYMSSRGIALKNAVPSALFSGRRPGKPRVTLRKSARQFPVLTLTAEQEAALEAIKEGGQGVFLLHGVTGSGKTEVYIRAIKNLSPEEAAIVLVPEIAITAQMIHRFQSHFGDDVAFYHSGLSIGERIAQWWKMKKGEVRIVIGVRSAVFAPFDRPGLIIVDEEQEASYKQFEGLKYSARDVALVRAKMEGIKIVLGSATPSVETFYQARKGKFAYLEMKNRIDRKPLPTVELIDMRKEDRETPFLSRKLVKVLRDNVAAGHQSLIMLNRRGYSPFALCTDCGYTYKCPACTITLTYHKDTGTLKCHYCGSYLIPRTVCPGCKGAGLKYLGVGTQRIEEEIQALIPELSFQRMDRDSTTRKFSHHHIVQQMEEKKIDVLIGTQMIARGHDFPAVTVAAVVSADVALNLPDFRSAERMFQLLTQLAGRAGRGDMPGAAYIQTHEPEHYVFTHVTKHDYKSFYEQELKFRKDLSYPPFSRLIRLVFSFRRKEAAARQMKIAAGRLKSLDFTGIEVLGPTPAPVEKIRSLWRWHIVLKGKNAQVLRKAAEIIIEKVRDLKDTKIDADVDPINLL